MFKKSVYFLLLLVCLCLIHPRKRIQNFGKRYSKYAVVKPMDIVESDRLAKPPVWLSKLRESKF